MNKEKIWLSSPHMGGQEIEFVKDAFETNWIAPLGPHVDGFEQDLCNYTGSSYAAALSSGTSAIHLSLIQLGVSQGDYVICQSFTFSGSANPIAYQGAIPVFIDSESETWNMDPCHLEEAIQACISGGIDSKGNKLQAKMPKAIIPVHLYGTPAKMDEIMEIARKYEIPVIEDAAEALGSRFQDKSCGTFGDFGILSFNGNKIITTSGGGALLSNNEDVVKKARFLATQARDSAPHYQHSEIGYNYRMSNVSAGIGRGQMLVLNDRVRQRRANFEYYKENLGTISGISFPVEPKDSYSNRWLSCILIEKEVAGFSREDIRLGLEKENIECRPLWKPMHMQPVFEHAPYFGGRISEDLFDKGLCLPSGSNLKDEDLERVVTAIRKYK
ncbi:MAG: aminotransferase class I/II-fold pyridoxal phosphate-dependent enzyme [Bacteroidia bacterium]|nr:aminotransferase class I/II-fold pyridoxal phosphate-dependent enzyme [Bacteroidia bacterium]